MPRVYNCNSVKKLNSIPRKNKNSKHSNLQLSEYDFQSEFQVDLPSCEEDSDTTEIGSPLLVPAILPINKSHNINTRTYLSEATNKLHPETPKPGFSSGVQYDLSQSTDEEQSPALLDMKKSSAIAIQTPSDQIIFRNDTAPVSQIPKDKGSEILPKIGQLNSIEPVSKRTGNGNVSFNIHSSFLTTQNSQKPAFLELCSPSSQLDFMSSLSTQIPITPAPLKQQPFQQNGLSQMINQGILNKQGNTFEGVCQLTKSPTLQPSTNNHNASPIKSTKQQTKRKRRLPAKPKGAQQEAANREKLVGDLKDGDADLQADENKKVQGDFVVQSIEEETIREEDWEDESNDQWDSLSSDSDWSACSPPASPPPLKHSFLRLWNPINALSLANSAQLKKDFQKNPFLVQRLEQVESGSHSLQRSCSACATYNFVAKKLNKGTNTSETRTSSSMQTDDHTLTTKSVSTQTEATPLVEKASLLPPSSPKRTKKRLADGPTGKMESIKIAKGPSSALGPLANVRLKERNAEAQISESICLLSPSTKTVQVATEQEGHYIRGPNRARKLPISINNEVQQERHEPALNEQTLERMQKQQQRRDSSQETSMSSMEKRPMRVSTELHQAIHEIVHQNFEIIQRQQQQQRKNLPGDSIHELSASNLNKQSTSVDYKLNHAINEHAFANQSLERMQKQQQKRGLKTRVNDILMLHNIKRAFIFC